MRSADAQWDSLIESEQGEAIRASTSGTYRMMGSAPSATRPFDKPAAGDVRGCAKPDARI